MPLREKANLEAALNRTGWKIYETDIAAQLFGLNPQFSFPSYERKANRIEPVGGLKKT
jgi:hypothetical protein